MTKKGSLLAAALLWFLIAATLSRAEVEAGKPAPDFCLPATEGERVCLKDFRGEKNVVLLVYVLDFTGG